jgi:tRNA nucleotidyltransferase (CCA-adding enzyme)
MFKTTKLNIFLPLPIITKLRTLECAGHEAYVVGGASLYHVACETLHNKNFDIPPKDYDIFTSADAETLLQLFPGSAPIGGQERLSRIFTIITSDGTEISSYRKGGPRLELGNNIYDHLRTCDYSINAIAIQRNGDTILPIDVISHIENQQLVAMGNPQDRIDEDINRVMRGFRVAGKYNLYIEGNLYRVLQATPLHRIPAENLRDEFLKLLTYPHGLNLFIVSGKFFELFPEMRVMQQLVGRGIYHTETVWEHSLRVYQEMLNLTNDPILLFGTLFHDYGKIFAYNPETQKFTGHDKIGAATIQEVFNRLKIKNSDQQKIRWIVEHHMWAKESVTTRRRKWYRFFNEMEKCNVNFLDFMAIQYADTCGRKINDQWVSDSMPDFYKWSDDQPAKLWHTEYITGPYPKHIVDLDITGHDLIALGIKPGPEIGVLLQRIYEMTLVDEIKNKKDAILTLVQKWIDNETKVCKGNRRYITF